MGVTIWLPLFFRSLRDDWAAAGLVARQLRPAVTIRRYLELEACSVNPDKCSRWGD